MSRKATGVLAKEGGWAGIDVGMGKEKGPRELSSPGNVAGGLNMKRRAHDETESSSTSTRQDPEAKAKKAKAKTDRQRQRNAGRGADRNEGSQTGRGGKPMPEWASRRRQSPRDGLTPVPRLGWRWDDGTGGQGGGRLVVGTEPGLAWSVLGVKLPDANSMFRLGGNGGDPGANNEKKMILSPLPWPLPGLAGTRRCSMRRNLMVDGPGGGSRRPRPPLQASPPPFSFF
jgi:hypothetical protein